MITEYKNSFFNKDNGSKAVIKTEAKPVIYKGFFIYERVKGTVFDVVKDGVCIGMYAGINGAKINIDKRAGRCLQHEGCLDAILGRTDCSRAICELCEDDVKVCAICDDEVVKYERIIDSGTPFHKKCYEKEFSQ